MSHENEVMPTWALATPMQTCHDAGGMVIDQGIYKCKIDGGLPDEALTCRRLSSASHCAAAELLR